MKVRILAAVTALAMLAPAPAFALSSWSAKDVGAARGIVGHARCITHRHHRVVRISCSQLKPVFAG